MIPGMKTYTFSRSMRAMKIESIDRASASLVLENGHVHHVGQDWLAAHDPVPGSYLTEDDHGHLSIFPTDPIREGYSQVDA